MKGTGVESSRKYIIAFALVATGMLTLFAALEKRDYDIALDNGAADAKNLAWVLEASLDATLRRLDTDLIAIASTAESSDLRQAELPGQHTQWNGYLQRFKTQFPEVTDFFLFDADGQLLFTSDPDAKPFNIADRHHFRILRDNPEASPFLSDIVIARTDGKPAVILGRALRDGDGRFRGIVTALLNLGYWQTVFDALDIGPNGLIALRRQGTHQLILRRPLRTEELNKPVVSSMTRRIAAGETVGMERFASPVDKVARTWAFRVLKDYAIYVTVAIADSDALAAWRRQGMIAALSVAAVLGLLGALLLRLWQAEVRRVIALKDLAESEAKVRELAYYDPLTGLPNRRLLLDRLTQGLAQALRFERSLALMFLDLDEFKAINDTLGHDVGDEVLKGVAKRLVGCVRSGDTVCRQGGDEFVILLTEIAQPADAAGVADKIIKALDSPFDVAGQELRVTTSIGIAVHLVGRADDLQGLMKKADIAMYAAKASGRNRFAFFAEQTGLQK